MTKSIIEFVQSYKKDIYKFGKAIVFEYKFNGVEEVSQHYMYIILKDEENPLGKDYKGFAICSDGLKWRELKNEKFSIPFFVQQIRRGKNFEIAMYYDEDRFIPVSHFKIGNWEE